MTRSTPTGSRFRYSGELKPLADYVEDVPGCEVLSLGHSLEIIKDLSDAESVAERYRLTGFTGTHAIGHVRMATESDVDISGAHPYWAYPFSDIAVVHNGQLTNYHMWRRTAGADRATGSSPSATPRSSPSTWRRRWTTG